MGRVMAKAPSPTSGCQKSGALGGWNSSAAKTVVVTTQPPSRTVVGSVVLRRGRGAAHSAAKTSSRAVHTVTDPHSRDSGTHTQHQGDGQDPHLVEGVAEPPGREAEDQHRREQGGERVPPFAQVCARDQLVVHGRGAALVAVRHRWTPAAGGSS